MTTFITGGASQSGIALAKLLKTSNRKVLIGSRSGRVPDGFDSVKFDWEDPSTFSTPFEKDNNIKYAYILCPPSSLFALEVSKPFIDLAIEKGMSRFVLMSGSVFGVEIGGDVKYVNETHAYLEKRGVEYVALRPVWFTDNFIHIYGHGIKANNAFETSIPTGRIPFVAIDDIAQAAFDAIIAEKITLKDPVLIGPDYVTFSEAAALLSKALERKIVHSTISKEESYKQYSAWGLKPHHVQLLVDAEEAAERGEEENWQPTHPKVVVGKVSVAKWIELNKARFD